MRRPLFHLFVIVSLGWAGCSTDRTGWDGDERFDTRDGGGPLDAGCVGLVCSRDLRSVRDCSGTVVAECSADQACGKGECRPPCEAAAANEGSIGCSFAVPRPNTEFARGSCAAFFVANNWSTPATLHFEFKGEKRSLDGAAWVPYVENEVVKHKKLAGPIPPGSGAIVFVSNERPALPSQNWIECPGPAIFDKEEAVYGTGIGHAPFVTTDVPVSMYSIYPYGGARSFAPSATLLLPTTSFRKNYIVASAWGGKGYLFGSDRSQSKPSVDQLGLPTLQVLAIEDDTSVELLPNVDIIGGGGVARGGRNTVATYKLQRGELLQLTQNNELTGSVLETSKPVGVFGGHTCMFVPSDFTACDSDNSQIPPLSAWGSEYAVLPAPNRPSLGSNGEEHARDPSATRIVGAVNDTELVYEPFQPEGAPNTLQSGELAAFFTHEPFVVRSQDAAHPFFVMNVMTGVTASVTMLGDPEVAVIPPTQQWLDDYGFFSDATYPLSTAFVVRRKVGDTFHDVDLDCAGPLGNWKPITPDFEWTFVEFSRYFKPVSYAGGTCADGAHRMHSDGPFTMNVWGLGPAASYEYAGGTGLRPATEIRVPVR